MKKRTAWNKGKKGWTNGTKAGFQRGHSNFASSDSSRKKISDALKKAYKEGRMIRRTGSKSPLWRGGISKSKGYRAFHAKLRRTRKKGVQGFHTLADWETLKAQYNFTCPCCKKSEPKIKLTEDHIIPISKGGSNNIENIQPLCVSCNSKKKTKIVFYAKR